MNDHNTKSISAVKLSLEEFITEIFYDLPEDEYIVFADQSERGKPGKAIPFERVAAAIRNIESGRARSALALYIGTATMFLDESGEVRNKNANFASLYCIVLDDIGTKCDPSTLHPELQQPSWIIETSPRNYQYGYILNEPIEDQRIASGFVDMVYSAGGWDSGGNIAGKLVRIPFGHNVKNKHKYDGKFFEVKLAGWNPERDFAPGDIMRWSGCDVSFADLSANVLAAMRKSAYQPMGAAAYSEEVLYHANGVTDEVAEWLLREGYVFETSGPWWRIKCPWHDKHSDPEDTSAGYSPLGAAGSYTTTDSRRFKCFHSHGKEDGTFEFLRWVVSEGGPEAPVKGLASELIARYAFVERENGWVDLKHPAGGVRPNAGFRNAHQQRVAIPTFTPSGSKTVRRMTEYDLAVASPNLLRLSETRYSPGDPIIVNGSAPGTLFLNECQMPVWHVGTGAGVDGVERFQDFLYYLIPNETACEWFIDHLAMKAQDPKYRGNPVLMTTPATGTGRGTLTRILRGLWGTSNVGAPGYVELIEGIRGTGFNSELRKLWLVVPEIAADTQIGAVRGRQNFEALKAYCDPAPTLMSYNRKYGGQWTENAYSSVILCSNHSDSLAQDMADRRFVRISNTTTPRPDSWFKSFHEWLNSADWEAEVWTWLCSLDVSEFNAGANLAEGMTDERQSQIMAGQGSLENLATLIIEYLNAECSGIFYPTMVIQALPMHIAAMDLSDKQRRSWESVLRRLLNGQTSPIVNPDTRKHIQGRLDGKLVTFRATVKGAPLAREVEYGGGSGKLVSAVENFSKADLLEHLSNRMSELGLT